MFHDGGREQWVYDAKRNVPTQHPWVEWGRIFYGDGITPRGKNWFGKYNMLRPEFYVYGDFRTGIGTGRNAGGRTDNFAGRLRDLNASRATCDFETRSTSHLPRDSTKATWGRSSAD
jgi:hypothetical protein